MSRVFSRCLCAIVVFATTSAAFAADPPARPKSLDPGLIATYSSGQRKIVRLALSSNFVLQAGESIHPQIGPDFTLDYDGVIRVLQAGDYAFSAADGAAITIDSAPAAKIHLAAGDHALHVHYRRKPGPARLQLTWSSDAFPAEPIPPAVLGHSAVPPEVGASATIERGRLLAEELNCIACHKSESPAMVGRGAPDLSTIGSRVNPQWVVKWLEDPRHFRAHATMPALLASEQDRRDVATYLASLKDTTTTRQVSTNDDAAVSGRDIFENVGCANCHGKDGVELNGQASKWKSPDALSRFLLDPTAVDPSCRMPSMMLTRQQTDSLAAFLFNPPKPDDKSTANWSIASHLADFEQASVDADAARGKTLVQSSGCLKCHAISGASSTATEAVALSRVKPAAGCLASQPPAGAAQYHLTNDERAALTAYVRSASEQPEVAAAPTFSYQENIQRFNCVACHTAEGFVPKQALDGVPPLAIAGQKLRPEWIHAVLEDKQRVRPWLRLRMPHFGPAVKPVADELIAVSGAGPVEEAAAPAPTAIRDGRKMVSNGMGNFGCITCHSFNGAAVAAPEQSRGPELTLMVSRVRPDWFARWMREPARIVPTTLMPAFFSEKPASESMPVINAMWGYLSMGKSMPLPDGVTPSRQQEFALTPIDVPLVQRCYLDGGGVDGKYRAIPRAVAVGLPGLTCYVFDPDLCQICYAWSGGFVNMTAGWNGRGDTHGKRLGTPFYNAPPGSPIYFDSLEKKPQMDYIGYSTAHDQVEMVYSVDGVEIHERDSASPRGVGLVRTFEFDPAGKQVYFVTQIDPTIKFSSSNGSFEPVPTPNGWETPERTQAVKISGSSKVNFSITVTPTQDGK
ncbi:MAG TPA: c-type cytochrome [Humisphaera sp.]|nr:c-type cytochrome [Humisphaera sp.]